MNEFESLKRINKLTDSINEFTGKSAANLTRAVQDLKNGYSSEEFIGIKYSAFDEETKLPTIADASSITNAPYTSRRGYGLFWNSTATTNGGYNVMLKEVYIPEGLTHLVYTFHYCMSLEKIHGSLEKVTSIGAAFRGCKALEEMPYMPIVSSVNSSAFAECDNLKVARFYKNPSSIAANAFNGCDNLKDIYVSWSEGEIANAPWGAVNATIHYNTKYDENHKPIV